MKTIQTIIAVLILGFSTAHGQTLEDYFKVAAENNPGLQAKHKEFEAAMQKVPQVSSLPDPTLSVGYFVSPVETRLGPQEVRFSLSQMFPWFGTLKAQGDAAALMAEAKYQSFLDARNKLYYQVAASYYPLVKLREMQLIEQENVDILQSYKSIANSRFRNASGTMVDVLRVDITLKDAETDLSILKQKETALLTSFNKLLNRGEKESVALSDSLTVKPVIENFRTDSLLKKNPMLAELDLKIKAGKASERAAKKQGLPRFGIGLDYVLMNERTDMDVPNNGRDALMPMVSMSLPIFRGKYKAAVKEARLMQQKYSLQKEDFANSLVSEYEIALFDIRKQQESHQLYQGQIRDTETALSLLLTAYSNSGKEFDEVLQMQQQLLKYEKLKVTAAIQYQIAVAKLNYLTAKAY